LENLNIEFFGKMNKIIQSTDKIHSLYCNYSSLSIKKFHDHKKYFIFNYICKRVFKKKKKS
jgi:hypothetical protein